MANNKANSVNKRIQRATTKTTQSVPKAKTVQPSNSNALSASAEVNQRLETARNAVSNLNKAITVNTGGGVGLTPRAMYKSVAPTANDKLFALAAAKADMERAVASSNYNRMMDNAYQKNADRASGMKYKLDQITEQQNRNDALQRILNNTDREGRDIRRQLNSLADTQLNSGRNANTSLKFERAMQKGGLNPQDTAKAEAFRRERNALEMQRSIDDIRSLSERNPLAGTAVSTFGNIGSAAITPAATVANKFSGKRDIDINAPIYRLARQAQAAREGTQQGVKNAFGISDYDANGNRTIASQVADFGTGTALSMMDTIVRSAFMGPFSGGLEAGLSAGAQGFIEAKEKGLDDWHAIATGTAQGIAEELFETVSLEGLEALKNKRVDGLKNLILNMGKQSVTEGSEEFFTDWANALTDYAINGGDSEWRQSYDRYIAMGMSEREAIARVAQDTLQQSLLSFLGGAVSGALLGGGTQLAEGNYNRQVGQALINEGQTYTPEMLLETAAGIETNPEAFLDERGVLNQEALDEAVDTQAYLRELADRTVGREITPAEMGAAYNAQGNLVNNAVDNGAEIEELPTNEEREEIDIPDTISNEEIARRIQERLAENSAEDREALRLFEESEDVRLPENVRENMIDAYTRGDMHQYMQAYKRAYVGGYNDVDIDAVMRSPMVNVYLSRNQLLQAYKDGAATANIDKKVTFKAGPARKGGLTYADNNATEGQKKIAQWAGNKTGFNVEIRSDLEGGAEIDVKAGVLRINPKSKNFNQSLAHELTHLIRQYDNDGYKTYQKLVVDALMNSRGESYDELYAQYEAAYGKTGTTPNVDDVIEEMVADGAGQFLNDEEFINKVVNEDRSLAEKIIDFFRGIVDALKSTMSQDNLSRTSKALRENYETYSKALDAWTNALNTASEKYQSGLTVDDADTEVISNKDTGEYKGQDLVSKDYSKYSLETFDSTGRQNLAEQLKKEVESKNMSKETADSIMKQMEWAYDMVQKYSNTGEFPMFSAWQTAEYKLQEDGTPVFSVVVPNGDYALNLDFTTVCKKRDTLDQVLTALAQSGNLNYKKLNQKQLAKINEIIKRNGFEIACSTCFVDSKRYNISNWAHSLTDGTKSRNGFNQAIASMLNDKVGAEYFNYVSIATEYNGKETFTSGQKLLSDLTDRELLKLNPHAFDYINDRMSKLKSNSYEYRMLKAIKENPSLRSFLNPNDFISSMGQDIIQEQNPALHTLLQSLGGSSRPKPSHGRVAYYSEIVNNKAFTPEAAYKVGGVRVQSFSDYMANMVFDYMQMIADMSAKQLPSHAYTKEPMFAKLYGMTGMKINMSIMPKAVDWVNILGIENLNSVQQAVKIHDTKQALTDKQKRQLKKYAGLQMEQDENGNFHPVTDENGKYIPIVDDETFPMEEALAIRSAEGYKQNCGTIWIGTSDEQIRTLLRMAEADMVIPYHASSLNPAVKEMRNIEFMHDYTSQQRTRRNENGKWKAIPANKEFDFYESLMRTKDGRTTANEYLAWCDEHGYRPKFDQFREEENYYKLLEDFRLYDGETSVMQGSVEMNFPGADSAFGDFESLMKESLKESNATANSLGQKLPGILNQITDELGLNNTKNLRKQLNLDYDNRQYAPVFYSKLQREIEGFKGDKIGSASVESYLKGKGVKDEEIKWSGIRQYLEGKKSVNKQELIDYLKANEMVVETKMLDKPALDTNDQEQYFEALDVLNTMAYDKLDEMGLDPFNTDFETDVDDDVWKAVYTDEDGKEHVLATLDITGTHWDEYTLSGGENYREIMFKLPGSDYENRAMHTHWKGETGVLAHARVQDFYNDDGGKVLFVEEIQSDWHNAGQQNGYRDEAVSKYADMEDLNAWANRFHESKEIDKLIDSIQKSKGILPANDRFTIAWTVRTTIESAARNNAADKLPELFKNGYGYELSRHEINMLQGFVDTYVKATKANAEIQRAKKSVPDAPFRDTYTNFALKNLLRMAAEGDYDYLAWTTGKMQEERWSSDYAEGYRIEYDQDIPKFLKKYGKQWGANLTNVTLPGDGSDIEFLTEQLDAIRNSDEWMTDRNLDYADDLEKQIELAKGFTVPAIVVNDAMKKSVLYEGQPRFQLDIDDAGTGFESDVLFNDNQDIQAAAETLGKILSDIDVMPTKKAINDAAIRLRKATGTNMELGKIKENLNSIYEFLAFNRNVDGADISHIAADFVGSLIDNSEATINPMDKEVYDDFRKKINTYTFHMPDGFDNEVEKLGGIGALRREFFGTLNITKEKGSTIDQVWNELTELYPEYFSKDIINPADQLEQITETLRALRPKPQAGMSDEDYDVQRYSLGQDVLKAFVQNGKNAEMREKYEKQLEKGLQKAKDKAKETKERARLRKLDREVRTNLLTKAQRLARTKGGPEFEAAKQELIGDLDLLAKGIRSDTVTKLEALKERAEVLAAKDKTYRDTYYIDDRETFSRLQKKHINDMTGQEVSDLTDKIVELLYQERAYKKMLNEQQGILVANVARRSIAQQSYAKGINRRNIIGSLAGRVALNMLNPTRAFQRIDGYVDNGVFTELGRQLNDGQTKMNTFVMSANKKFNGFLENHKDLVKDWAKANIEIRDSKGNVAFINKGMRIALYLHGKNKQNLQHIAYGGIMIPDEQLYNKGRYEDAFSYAKRLYLRKEDIEAITAQMTEDEKAFAQLAHDFLNKDTKDAINETALMLSGTYKANVDNYFPIKVDPNFTMGDITGLVRDGTIEGMGMLKERKEDLKPVLMEDVAQVLQRQINNTGRYYGLAIPVRDANKVLQFNEKGNATSVEEAIGNTWGKAGKNYINDVLNNIQAGAPADNGPGADIFNKLKGTYAGTVLNWNLGVAMKQAASAPFAATVLDAKSVARAFAGKNLFTKADYDYMDSITPWSYMRRQGQSGTEMGEVYKQKNTVQQNQAWQKFKQKMNWIQAVDVWTTDRLFFATEYYVQDHFPDLEVRGEAYNKKVAEIYNDMLQRTQPSYDVMQRNAYLRSGNALAKITSMFKTQTYNMGGEVIDAASKLMASKRLLKDGRISQQRANQIKAQFGRTVAYTAMSQMMLTMLGIIAKAAMHQMKNYRDDKGEVTAESIAARGIYDFLTSFAGMMIGGNELQSFGLAVSGKEKWYDLEYPGLAVVNDLLKSSVDMSTAFGKALESGWSAKQVDDFRKKAIQFSMNAAIAGRIPANNIYNLGNAMYLWNQDRENGKLGTFDAGEGLFGIKDSSVTKDQYAKQVISAYEKGDTAKAEYALQNTNKDAFEKSIGAEAKTDENGDTIDGSKKQDAISKIMALDISDEDKAKILDALYPAKALDAWKELGGDAYSFYAYGIDQHSEERIESFKKNGLNVDEYIKYASGKKPQLSDVPDRGYDSYDELRTAYGNGERNQNIHHLVEQEQVENYAGFDAKKVQNFNNVVSIPSGASSVHSDITKYYRSQQGFTDGKSVSEWLASKPFEEQWEFGMNKLLEYGDVVPTESGWLFIPDNKKIEEMIPVTVEGKADKYGVDIEKMSQWDSKINEAKADGKLTDREIRDISILMLTEGVSADEAYQLYTSQKNDAKASDWVNAGYDFEDYLEGRNAMEDAKKIGDEDQKRDTVVDYLKDYTGSETEKQVLWNLAGYGNGSYEKYNDPTSDAYKKNAEKVAKQKENGVTKDTKEIAKTIDAKIPEDTDKYLYVSSSKEFTPEEKVAWFKSDSSRTEGEKYKAWKKVGGVDYDYIKYRGDISRYKGLPKKEKKAKVTEYINSTGLNAEKKRVLWTFAGYKESTCPW